MSLNAYLHTPIFPAPREWTPEPQSLSLNDKTSLRCSPAQKEQIQAFLDAASLNLSIEVDESLPKDSWSLGEGDGRVDDCERKGGYHMHIHPRGIAAKAADSAGLHASLQSLWQLLVANKDLGCATIHDWPCLRVRSFQLDLGRQPESAKEIKRLVANMARHHYNECQLYLENSIKIEAFGIAADPDSITPQELRDIQEFGLALGVDVVPSMNLLGHMEKLTSQESMAHLCEMSQGERHAYQTYKGCLCPELPESREFITRVVDEICAVSLSEKFMTGLDECWTLGSHPETRKKLDDRGFAGQVFADWIKHLHAAITKHNKKMWMWEDMLFYHEGSRDQIPTDVGMNIWHYQHIESIPQYSFMNWRRVDSVGELHDKDGHPYMLCCGPDLDHLHSMIRYSEGRDIDGVLVVQWEGSWTVQEYWHNSRVRASAMLWNGDYPNHEAAAMASTGCDQNEAAELSDLFHHEEYLQASRKSGDSRVAAFWSFPETPRARSERAHLARRFDKLACQHESLEVLALFNRRNHIDLTVQWLKENAALVARDMLNSGRTSSPIFDGLIREARETLESSPGLGEIADNLIEKYSSGLKVRPMSEHIKSGESTLSDLLDRMETFAMNPSEATFPFHKQVLVVDGLSHDPCAHFLELAVANGGGDFKDIYDRMIHLPPSLEGQFTMAFPIDEIPSEVRVKIGGFASVALTRIRIESLAGTQLAKEVKSSEGQVQNPEHLLEFDRKSTLFNEPDVIKNWTQLEALEAHQVTLSF